MKNKFIMILKLFIILTIVSITLGREILISDNIHKGKAMEIKSTSIGDSGTEEVSTSLDGAGTEESPYLIKSAADMRYMRDVINNGIRNGSPEVINGTEESNEAISAYYKLDDSISENGIDLGENWEAICSLKGVTELNDDNTFRGYFDGNNKKIIFSSNEEGLFGAIGNVTIKDLTVNANIDNSGSDDISVFNIGIIAGFTTKQECKILGCRIEGSIKIDGHNKDMSTRVGGVVGVNNGLIKDTECLVSINCSNIITNFGGVGGIIGLNSGVGQLINCNYELEESKEMNLNNVKGYSGGVIGYNMGKASNIVCTANVKMDNDGTGYRYFGGGMGYNSGEVYNTVLEVQIEGKSTKDISGGYIGGIIAKNCGKLYNSYVKGKILSEMDCYSTFVYLGGLVGYNTRESSIGKIDNCYSMLNIIDKHKESSTRVKKGSIIGDSDAKEVNNCFGFNYDANGIASSLKGENIKENGTTSNKTYNFPLDKNWLKKILNLNYS